MADTKITGLTAATSLATTDIIPVVTDPGGTPATKKITVANFKTAMAHTAASATRASTDLTLNNTSWTDVDNNLDLTIAAASGDKVLINLSALFANEAVNAALDAATIVSSNPVNYIATAGGASGLGVQGWLGLSGASEAVGCSVMYTVVAGDISGGNVVFRLRYRTTAASAKTLRANANQPLQWSAVNLNR
jgi:hypothetical protein